MRYVRGFTLVEMLITVAVLGILVAIAVPSFNNMIERNQVATASNDLLSSLLAARSEAVKQERNVVVAKDGSWSDGWTIKDPDDNLILQHKTTHDNLSVAGNGEVEDSITYAPSGRTSVALTAGDDYFDIAMGDKERCVIFSTTGRPSVGDCP